MSAPYNFPAYPGFTDADDRRKGISFRDLIFLHVLTGLASSDAYIAADGTIQYESLVRASWQIADEALDQRVDHYHNLDKEN